MSTENNPIVETVEDDLDTFAATFFGQKDAPTEEANPEEVEDTTEQESDAPTEDAHIDEADTLEDTEDDDTTDEEETPEDPEDKPQPKKNRFQERIDEVVGKQREAERKLEAALAELERLKQTPTKTEDTVNTEDNKPSSEAVNEDGTPKYPLGEFDPDYISDLVKYNFAKEKEAADTLARQEAEQNVLAKQQEVLQTQWNEKLVPAKERYPDFEEKGQSLLSTFEGIDAAYGEYLSSTLMSMDFGPDVLYYLANNPDEATAIVNSGATKATIALGRLEAKFADAALEKQLARPKVSNAPTPPERLNKGSSPVIPDTPDDTDDLDAFEKKFFKKRR